MAVICSNCNADEVICYRDEATALCPTCCEELNEEHNYEYAYSERGWYCVNCCVQAPPDYLLD